MQANRSNAFRNLACLTSLAFCVSAAGAGPQRDLNFLAPGLKLEHEHNLAGALEQYNNAVQAHPDCWEAFTARGGICAQLGQQKEAMSDFNKAISLHPDKCDPYVKRSRLLDEWGQGRDALADALTALKMAPEDAEALLQLGFAKWKLGDEKGATEAYRLDIQKNPKFVKAYVALSRLLEAKDSASKESMDLLNKAIALEPTNFSALFARATVYKRQGKNKEAAADLRKAADNANKQGERALAVKVSAAADALDPANDTLKRK
jgi:tetratricopeptide (TPR) repeat protein